MKIRKPIIALICVASLFGIAACGKSKTTTAKQTTTEKVTTTAKQTTTLKVEKKVNYTVKHCFEQADGTYLANEELNQTIEGIAGEKTNAQSVQHTSNTHEATGVCAQVDIKEDGSTIVMVKYDLKTAKFKINAYYENLDGTYADAVELEGEGKIGTKTVVPKQDYYELEYDKKDIKEDGTTEVDVHYKRAMIEYTVVHKFESYNEDTKKFEYVEKTFLCPRTTQSGRYGELTNATAHPEYEKEIYNVETINQELISSKGMEIEIKYSAKEFTYTKGEEKHCKFKITYLGEEITTSKVVKATNPITVEVTPDPGYKIKSLGGFPYKYNNATFFALSDLTINVVCEPMEVEYKVVHKIENLDGEYISRADLPDETKTALTDTVINKIKEVARMDFEGFSGFTPIFDKTETVSGDGSTVVTVLYYRNTYDIDVAPAAEHGKITLNKTSEKYGYTITAIATTDPGYEISAINLEHNGTTETIEIPEGKNLATFTLMGDTKLTYEVKPLITTYKVIHKFADENGNYKQENYITETLKGEVDSLITVTSKGDESYSNPLYEVTTVAYDGSTVVEVNYVRKYVSYTLSITNGTYGNVTSGTSGTTMKAGQQQVSAWGKPVTLVANPTNSGTNKGIFAGWYVNGECVSYDSSYTFVFEYGKTYNVEARFDYITKL